MNATIVPYTGGSEIERASAWVGLPDDERRRRAMAAAQAHDVDTLCGLADAWLTIHGRAGATVSPHTRDAYRRGVVALLATWEEQNLLHPRRDAGALWLRAMEAQGLKPATVKQRRAAGQALYAALRWAGATEADPLRDAHATKDPVAPWEKRKPYSALDVTRLVEEARGDDRVLVLLGAHAGLRVSEMLALRWADVDLGSRTLLVRRGKGGKVRTVAVSKTLAVALDAWREECLRHERGIARQFVVPYRTRFSARRRLRLVCAAAGVEPRAIHSLRHAAGTRVMQETNSLEETARHLGHSTVETARIYAKWSNTRLKATVGEW